VSRNSDDDNDVLCSYWAVEFGFKKTEVFRLVFRKDFKKSKFWVFFAFLERILENLTAVTIHFIGGFSLPGCTLFFPQKLVTFF